jgi:hypothetical protein
MTSPKYISQISFGNVITLTVLLITAAIAWGQKEVEVKNLMKVDAKVERDIYEIEVRVRVLESSHSAILAQLTYIKNTLDQKLK